MAASLTVDGAEQAHRTLYRVSVDGGRDDVEAQPDGTVMQATMSGLGPEQVGHPVVLADGDGRMFAGTVTDLTATSDTAGAWTVELTATGPLAQPLGTALTGTADWPEESDSRRIVRILDDVAAPHAVDPDEPGPALIARTAEPDYAAELARQAATSGSGVLWEQPADPDHPIRYTPARMRQWATLAYTWADLGRDPSHRWTDLPAWDQLTTDGITGGIAQPPSLELDPATALISLTFEQTIGDVVRTVVVTYGTPGDGTDRPTVTAGSGEPARDYDTQLATAGDAATYATNALRRQGDPRWRLASIVVDLGRMLPGERTRFRGALWVGARITVPMPLGSPVGTVWQGYLEGWRHELVAETPDAQSHTVQLKVSDRWLTEVADRWSEIPDGLTWDATDPTMTWNAAVDWKVGISRARAV